MNGGRTVNRKLLPNYLASIALTLVGVILLALSVFELTTLSPNLILSGLKSESYESAYKETLDSQAAGISRYTGIPEEVLKQDFDDPYYLTLPYAILYDTFKTLTNPNYQATDDYLAGTSLYSDIDAYLTAYLNTTDHADQTNEIYTLAKDAITLSATLLAPEVLTIYASKVQSLVSKLGIVFALTALVYLALGISLFVINKRHKHRVFWWWGSSLLASGVTAVIPAIVIYVSGMLGRLETGGGLAFTTYVTILRSFLNLWLTASVVIILVGAGLIVAGEIIRKRKKHHHH